MFKNMKLATKMALGFGALVLIAGGLGLVGWNGVSGITTTVALDNQGTECLNTLNSCAALRRDFAIQGFEKREGEDLDASQKWQGAYEQLVTQLRGLQNEPDLDAEKRGQVGQMLTDAENYKAIFEKQVAARQSKDDAFAAWGQVGWGVTEDITRVIDDVIKPAQQAAAEAQELATVLKWAEISDRLDKEFIQPFLLLRVTAVYLLATDRDAQYEGYQKQFDKVRSGLAAWTQLSQGEQQLEAVGAKLRAHLDRYEAAGQQYYQGVLAERSSNTEMAVVATRLVDTMHTLQGGLKHNAQAITSRTYTLVGAVSLGAIVLGVLLAVIITRSIVKPINRIIDALNEGADQVNDAAAQVSMASQQLAEGASEQASSLEETSSALEQMAAMTRNNADGARQASELSDQTRTAAQSGDRTMHQLNEAMDGINESSNQISKIIKVIEEIAFQTNLLALNAAVEAARAGEHGKGFAVVADEVRNLAQRAAKASGEITELIEESVGKARQGTTVAADVGKALTNIVENVSKVAELINGIAKASEEQAQGVDQVNTAVSQMDKVTQTNAAGAEESASAAEEMAAQATAVKGMVNELAVIIGGNGQRDGTHSATPAMHKPLNAAHHSPHPQFNATAPSKNAPKAQGWGAGPASMPASGEHVHEDDQLQDF